MFRPKILMRNNLSTPIRGKTSYFSPSSFVANFPSPNSTPSANRIRTITSSSSSASPYKSLLQKFRRPTQPITTSSLSTTASPLSLLAKNIRRFTTSPRSFVKYYPTPAPVTRPSFNSYKQRFNRLPENYIIYGLIAANLAVFGAWQWGQQKAVRFRDARWMNWLERNFTTSVRNLREGRIWVLLSSCFSHSGTSHILFNMMTLYFMASPVISILGNTGFLTLYFVGGIVSSGFSLLFHKFVDKYPNRYYTSHGASGSIYAMLVFFACAMPNTTFLIFFVIPAPAWLCVTGLISYDTYNAFKEAGGQTDSAGHMGGAGAGFLYFLRKMGRI